MTMEQAGGAANESWRAQLGDWVGRKETRHDVAHGWPVAALAATLDRNEPELMSGNAAGAAIPLGWHWLYFLDAKPASELGPDGHPRRGGFLPPIPLPRRMWAGGRLEFVRPLRVGETIRRDSEIVSIESKQGRSGALVFVTVRHLVHAGGALAVREEHDIVYRDMPRANEPMPAARPAPAHAPWRREIQADPVLLFRFSALTFNGHRIHYDLDYATREEHYPGLVVHGPLQTLLMLDLCRRQQASRPVRTLDYRAVHPIFHTERFTVNGHPGVDGSSAELWTANAAGSYAMTGAVAFA